MAATPPSNGPDSDLPDVWSSRPAKKKPVRIDLDEPGRAWWKRPWAIALAAVVLLIGVLIALGPTIASGLVPSRVTVDDESRRRVGEVLLDDVRLSWFGPQRVGSLELRDGQRDLIVKGSASVSAGLLTLGMGALGWGDLDVGTVRLAGEARVVRGPDGSTNLDKVIQASSGPGPSDPPASAEPARLPGGFKGRLVLDSIDVTYVDASRGDGTASVAKVRGLNGDAALRVGGPVTASLRAEVLHGTDESKLTGTPGTVSLTASADGLTDASGLLTPELARLDVTLEAASLPVEAFDAIAGAEGALRAALGERLQARVRVLGTAKDATATLGATSESLNADVELAYIDGVVRANRPGTVRLRTAGLAPLLEASEGGENGEPSALRLTEMPEVALTIEELKVHAPVGGAEPDLRGSAARIALRTGRVAGTVLVPASGEAGAAGQARPFEIAPAEVVLEAPDLGQGLRVRGGTSATLAGQSAGRVLIDVAASGLLDARGRPRSGLPSRLEGSVVVNEVATAIAEPFLPTGVVDLREDLGPTVNFEVRAQTLAESLGAEGGAPPTRVTLAANAANLTATGGVTIEGGVVSAPERALEARLASVGPLLTRALGEAGVSVSSGGPVTLTVDGLRVDTAKVGGETPDLRGVSAQARLTTGTFSGTAALREGEAARPWQVAPLTVAVDARDLASGASVRATTSATLSGEPAGSLDVDVRAAGLLDSAGGPVAGLPRRIEGRVALEGVSTAIAQPWAVEYGLELPRDIGPTVNVELTAATAGEATAAGELPPTRVNVAVKAQHLTAAGAALVDRTQVATVEPGFEVNLTQAAPIVAAMMGPGVRPGGEGFITATVQGLRVPLEEGAPRMDRAAGQIGLRTGRFSLDVTPLSADGAPAGPPERIGLVNVALTTVLNPGQPTRVSLNAALQRKNEPVRAVGELALAGLFPAPGATPGPLPVRPVGRMEFTGLPTALARLVPSAPAEPGAAALDVARLVQEAVGPALDMTFVSEEEGAGGPLNMRLGVQGERMTAQAAARLASDRLDVQRAEARSRLTPELAGVLIGAFAPEMNPRPRLAGPSNLTVSLTPLMVPLGEGLAPDLSRAPEATLTAVLEGEAIVEGLTVEGEEPGTRRDLGPVGIGSLNLKASVPPAALVAASGASASAPKEATFTVTGRLLSGPGVPLGDLNVEGSAALAGGAPSGPMSATIRLTEVNTKGLDRLAGAPGLVSGALGERVAVQTTLRGQMVAPAAGEEAAGATLASGALSVNIGSPRLKTVQPMHLSMTEGKLALNQPAELRWTVDPAWASAFLAAEPEPGARPAPPAARFSAPMDVAVRLPTLALARGDEVGPLLAGVFDLNAEVVVPRVQMELSGTTPAVINNVRATVTGGREPGVVAFSMVAEDAGAAPEGGAEVIGRRGGGTINVEGAIRRLADGRGVPTPEAAELTLSADAAAVPTVLIDALAQQGGVLVEALGPTVTVEVRATELSGRAGTLSADARSERARATLRGRVEEGVFVAQGPVVVEVNEITPELGGMMVRVLPVLGSLAKPRDAAPAQLRVTGLTAPLDGDLRRLNGEVEFDPGSARFETSKAFAALLKGAGARQAGTIGERLQPMRVNVRDGVATYERITVPLGEFSVQSRGAVDLANRTLDVVTYLPVGSLTDEAAGVFKSGVGQLLGGAGALEAATMVPFRTRGSFEGAETKPDLELFAREFTQQISPEKLIRGGLEELLKGQNKPAPSGGGGN